MLKESVVAPDFSAVLDDGQRFQLSAYKRAKNVVLYFYPQNFTPGCPAKRVCSGTTKAGWMHMARDPRRHQQQCRRVPREIPC
ncbi:MAG: redoxin domain-containing protein [Elusimicrobia bacterium]|nr:redoxin domain-containing protein [Elusimicrobiota bacterium]